MLLNVPLELGGKLSGLASTDPKFHVYEWDNLIPQAGLAINMLRNSMVNPKLSSYS